jgi:pSer/pThr/pTyr-binding forkhead associated (FHA) protein
VASPPAAGVIEGMSATRFFLKKVPQGNEVAVVGSMSVGRSEESALRLLEGKPSRNHALLSNDGTSVFVEDLGSTNGTFVNDRRIDAKVRTKLNAGDRVRFDTEEFIFGSDAPAAPPIDADKTQFRAPAARKPEPDAVPSPTPTPTPPPAPAAAKPEAPPKAVELPGSFADGGGHTKFVPKPKTPKAPALNGEGLAVPVAQPYLLLMSGEKAGTRIELSAEAGAKRVWTIGSGTDRDICMAEAGVSAKHASLTHEANRWLLVDDLSVSGTYVNDKKTLRSFLSDGDQLMIGPIECLFRIPPPPERAASVGGGRVKKIGVIVAAACLLTLIAIFVLIKVLK